MKISKRLLLIIIVLIGIASLLGIRQYTLAKYKDRVKGTTTIGLASWNIIVNNESIIGKANLDAEITPVFTGNAYVSADVLAPGTTGYYDIVVDPSNVDVAFSYTITASVSPNSDVTDLVVSGYEINPTGIANIQPYNTSLTGNIFTSDGVTTIRIYVTWDDTNGNMDNEDDTNVIIDNTSEALMDTTILFNQIVGS